MKPERQCLKTWHIERHDNPWSGLTATAQTEQQNRTVKSTREKLSGKNLVRRPAALDQTDYLLLRLEKDTSVRINGKYFSELHRIDVTGAPLQNDGLVGYATEHALKIWQPREILELLLEYQILQTYAHIEAQVCLISERTEGDLWMADLTGEHVYYTNSRNEAVFAFGFRLNRKTGEMRVRKD